MNLDHRLDKLEGMLDAASAEVERQRTGSLWDLISRGDYERACGGWTFLAVSLGRSARAIGPTATAAQRCRWRTSLMRDPMQRAYAPCCGPRPARCLKTLPAAIF